MTAIPAGISAHRGRRLRPWFPAAAARTARDNGGIEVREPLLAPGPVEEHEHCLLMVGVEKQQEGAVTDPVTVTVWIWQRVTVEEDGEGFGDSCLPVVRHHLVPVRPEPPDVGRALAHQEGRYQRTRHSSTRSDALENSVKFVPMPS